MMDAKGQKRLEGRIAVITGAGAGIGKGCAAMFAAQGAIVYGLDRNAAGLEATKSEAGINFIPRTVDLLDEKAAENVIAEIGTAHGRIDILVPAAAFSLFAWIDEMSYDQWRKTLAGELDIVFLVTRAAWPYLKASGKGSIINFASANSHVALDGSPALAHCAGKGGILAMTRQLAMEGAPHGIRANSIAPGLILTEQTARHMQMDAEFEGKAMQKMMIKRIGRPEDIAWCAVWLGSDESTYVTAADISIDGGATAW
ncbi:SDR family NAD(P)-dependent oxidoreductase [Rhizobium alvei]|uniref:SDR family NAD(P)-dependent oxidoreductase n=1 Tax=Rhizobium alvei TaxID=1132659 RepID=A0ABT8YRI5_9HYPH|nr:SDR family NAD(P)-dependent oxidoreductase [Rhizobium alvei]MDO6966141.1 SDR family NAD(P)-dependent oxidoreductase [Rhizobium alvei]